MTTNHLQIRAAEPDDADVIARFNVALAWETERTRLDPETVARGVRTVFADPKHGFYVVAARGEEIVGSLLVTFEWSDWRNGLFWWIQSVYVKPTSRRQGVFKRLYEHVKAQAAADPAVGGLRLYAEKANHIAHQTYARLGMRKAPYEIFEELL